MPGPLPQDRTQRRNAATIPTTNLPAGGRRGPVPGPPEWMKLGRAGMCWWKWAWHTPQACGWSAGDEVLIARRAALEDDLTAAVHVDFDGTFLELLEAEDMSEVRIVMGHLASLVSGRMVIYREQREIDDRLGLTPKGLSTLRWRVVADEVYYPASGEARGRSGARKGNVTDIAAKSRRARLLEE